MATTTKNLQKEIAKTTTDAVDYAKNTVESVQKDLADTAGDVKSAVNRVFLAGLGALAVAEEEGSKTFKKLVKKGEAYDLPGLGSDRVKAIRDQVNGVADKATGTVKDRVNGAKKAADDTADKAEDRIQDTVATVMKRLGVPTREEIAALTASVERLTTHVERLKDERTASTDLTMEAVGGGWYEIRIGTVVVEKVQGKEEAEKALVRVQEQRA